MMRRWLAIGLLGLPSCAAVWGFDTLDRAAGASSDELASRLAEAVCRDLERCQPSAMSRTGQGETCRSSQQLLLRRTLSAAGDATAAQVEACVSALATNPCGEGFRIPECAYTGTRGMGEPCNYDAQCVSGACRETGETCGACGEPYKAEGEPCKDDCRTYLECFRGLCRRRGQAGATCDSNADCRTNLRCSDATCAPPAAAGGACQTNEDCDRTQLLACVANRCVAYTLSPAGGRCQDSAGCERGSCDITNQTCVAAKNEGETVSGLQLCADPFRNVNGVCSWSTPDRCQ